jgi:glycosyltransferase involved in cell wall biosynthesis
LHFALKRSGFHNEKIDQRLLLEALRSVDRRSSRFVDEADVLVALSGSGTESGEEMRRRGKVHICDRGSSHILYQQNILNEEADLHRAPRPFFDPRVIEREIREYESSNVITVPSTFAERSFAGQKVPLTKVRKVSYGVNLSVFHPTAPPSSDVFDILFVGSLCLRKGIPYLLKAFAEFRHPRKRLTLVGMRTPETRYFESGLSGNNIRVLGPVPHLQLKHIMSTSQVMVLPSVEEGLALVMAEALACGCPVIATTNTGAEDLFENGKEGFIVPIRDPAAIREKLDFLADTPQARAAMSSHSLERVNAISGWKQYGDNYFNLIRELA